MSKKRNRSRPAGSFEDRLQKFADEARSAARRMPPGRERDILMRDILRDLDQKRIDQKRMVEKRAPAEALRTRNFSKMAPGDATKLHHDKKS